MRPRLEDLRIKMLEKCFDCFCQNGLENTSTRKLAEACGMTDGNIFHYFTSKDEIIIKSTAYCMAKVEDGVLLTVAMERDTRFSEGKRRREQKEGL